MHNLWGGNGGGVLVFCSLKQYFIDGPHPKLTCFFKTKEFQWMKKFRASQPSAPISPFFKTEIKHICSYLCHDAFNCRKTKVYILREGTHDMFNF